MFAHARFERRVRDLLVVINPGLIRSNECDNWSAHNRPKKTKKLIAECLPLPVWHCCHELTALRGRRAFSIFGICLATGRVIDPCLSLLWLW